MGGGGTNSSLRDGVRPLVDRNRVAEILPIGAPLQLVVLSEISDSDVD